MSVDTVVAIATPPGRGGVGIVRLSGPQAYHIGLLLIQKTSLDIKVADYRSFYSETGELLDQGIVLYFKAPHSFTGEDVVEFQAHGAPIVLDRLVKTCVVHGARIAKPGEFSERAFLNNKIDLTQAEAISDLIAASSETAAKMAMRSLQGDFSRQIQALNDQLIALRLYVEAAIDFPEEEIDFLNDGKVLAKLTTIIKELSVIRNSANQGTMLREGLSVVIAGRPNAGKSTLINCLARRDVAIVTEVAGTTRDVMREHILLDDLPICLIDTAGLRESDDAIEKEGIRRAWLEVARADCLLMVIDTSTESMEESELSEAILNVLPAKVPVIQVFNKIDQLGLNPKTVENAVYLCAKTGEGVAFLHDKIKQAVGYVPTEGQFIARSRHLDALDRAKELLNNGYDELMSHRRGELLAEDLRLAHLALCEITGEFTSDDLLGEIFSSFCIGK